eukprot:5038345-Prymnesium_polylepis.1
MNCKTIQQGIDGNFTFHEAFVTSDNCRAWEGLWRVVEVGSIIVFTAELVLRGATVPDRREAPRTPEPVIARTVQFLASVG